MTIESRVPRCSESERDERRRRAAAATAATPGAARIGSRCGGSEWPCDGQLRLAIGSAATGRQRRSVPGCRAPAPTGTSKLRADRPCPFAPRQEDGRRIVDDGALKCRNAGLVVGRRRQRDGWHQAPRRPVALRSGRSCTDATRVPEQVRTNEVRSLNVVRQHGVEVTGLQPSNNLLARYAAPTRFRH